MNSPICNRPQINEEFGVALAVMKQIKFATEGTELQRETNK